MTFELEKTTSTAGTAVVIDRTAPARALRAVGGLLGCWGAMLVCVFIPLLHFILVPGLFVTGIVLFIKRVREDVSLKEIHAACPRCKVPRIFATGGRWYEGRTIHCDGCGEQPALVARL